MDAGLVLWRADAGVFALSVAVLVAIWLAYPAAVGVWAWARRRRQARPAPSGPAGEAVPLPRLSVIVAAHDEAAHIAARIENLVAQGYPPERLEILVAEDGSRDRTAEIVDACARRHAPGGVRVLRLSLAARAGKAAAMNRAAAAAAGDILLFTDANNLYGPGALQALVRPFADPAVGAVTGRKSVAADAGVGGGESIYWKFEGWLVAREAGCGSTVAGFGEALAVRRACFVALPTRLMLNDDLYLTLQVLAQGKRVLAAPTARSFELAASTDQAEWERRARMTVGRWQALAELRGRWPGISPANRVKILFHEILRPLSALGLALALATGLPLLGAPAGALGRGSTLLVWTQALAYLWVTLVALTRRRGWSWGRGEALYFFVLALCATWAGTWRYLRGGQSPLWRRVERAATPAAATATTATAAPAPASRAGAGMTSGHILNGLFWAGSAFVLGKLLVLGSVMVLARILNSQQFGMVALAISTITVLEIFGTLGLTSALIYEDAAVAGVAQICFWTTLATAAFEAALLALLAPRLAGFFHEPGLAPMLRVLSLCLVINALGLTHDTLLRRQLSFQRKMLPDLGMAAVKGVFGIALALCGFGAWSLIWAQVLGTATSTLLLWRVSAFRPRWDQAMAWDRAMVRRAFHYSKHIYLLDASSVVLTNFDALTIGRMLGDAVLGFYTLAFRIPEVLLLSALNVVTRVMFPALSRLQMDRAVLCKTLLQTTRYTTLVTLPIAAGLALMAREVVVGFYGWKWLPAVPVLRVLALYGGLRCIAHHFGDAYKAIGRPGILVRVTSVWWVLLPPALILGARWGGIVGVAWGEVAARTLMIGVHFRLVVKVLGVKPRQLWDCYAPALEATAAMSLVMVAVRTAVAGMAAGGMAVRPELALLTLTGAVVYCWCLWMRHPEIVAAIMGQARGLRPGASPDIEPAAVGAGPGAAAALGGGALATAAMEPKAGVTT